MQLLRIVPPSRGLVVRSLAFDEFAEIDEQNVNREAMPDGGVVIYSENGIAYRSPDGVCICVSTDMQ